MAHVMLQTLPRCASGSCQKEANMPQMLPRAQVVPEPGRGEARRCPEAGCQRPSFHLGTWAWGAGRRVRGAEHGERGPGHERPGLEDVDVAKRPAGNELEDGPRPCGKSSRPSEPSGKPIRAAQALVPQRKACRALPHGVLRIPRKRWGQPCRIASSEVNENVTSPTHHSQILFNPLKRPYCFDTARVSRKASLPMSSGAFSSCQEIQLSSHYLALCSQLTEVRTPCPQLALASCAWPPPPG